MTQFDVIITVFFCCAVWELFLLQIQKLDRWLYIRSKDKKLEKDMRIFRI